MSKNFFPVKTRLNKKILADMPDQVRALVQEWTARYRKNFIGVQRADGFYPSEDSRVTLVNLMTGATGSAQAAGNFAGFTNLSPGSRIPLPNGIVAVERGFHCGVPFLDVWQGTAPQITE